MTKVDAKRYQVGTNGLSGKTSYMAKDPDEALMFAQRTERFLRLKRDNPSTNDQKLMEEAKRDAWMPDFRIEYVILEKE